MQSTNEYATIISLDSYFSSCVEIGQGINSKERVEFTHAVADLVKSHGIGVVLDLDKELSSDVGRNLLRDGLLQVHPDFDKLFA